MGALAIFLFCVTLPFTRCELSPKEVDMIKMISTHEKIFSSVVKYVAAENARLEKIRSLLPSFVFNVPSTDDSEFISNPVYSYVVPKRITRDFDRLLDLVFSNESHSTFDDVLINHSYPTEEYVDNSAQSLLWLQEIHNNTKNPTFRKHFKKIESTSAEISARDCFDIGLNAYQLENPNLILYWMTKAYSKLSRDEMGLNKTLILEHISTASFEVGDYMASLLAIDEILKLSPGHRRSLKNLRMVFVEMDKAETAKAKRNGTEEPAQKPKTADPKAFALQYYKSMCAELKSHESNRNDLFCRFRSNSNPRLLLQPAKEEDIHLHPKILLYHNVLSENEINALKELVAPKLVTAKVVKVVDERLSRFRTSLNAWLNDTKHEVVERIDRRIGDITGLSMETSEFLQVANYGVGGYYKPHLDAFGAKYVEENNETLIGDRLATWMVYLNDVTAGGSTVFPLLDVSVKPKKGSALFWYNLYDNSSHNVNTLHASCPVVSGTKWVLNKWIRERGQEFTRPCSAAEAEKEKVLRTTTVILNNDEL